MLIPEDLTDKQRKKADEELLAGTKVKNAISISVY